MVNAAYRNGKHSRSQQVDFSMAFRTPLAILLSSFSPWLQATNSSDLHSLSSEAEDGHHLNYSTAHFTQSSNMKLIPRHGSEHVRTTHKQESTAQDQFFYEKNMLGKNVNYCYIKYGCTL